MFYLDITKNYYNYVFSSGLYIDIVIIFIYLLSLTNQMALGEITIICIQVCLPSMGTSLDSHWYFHVRMSIPALPG